MASLAYLMTFRVPPQNEFQADTALRGLHHAMAAEEFAAGGVEVFAIHRVPDDPGAYQIYEQYSKAAEARHGNGPQVKEAWGRVLARMVAPFERIRLEPLGVFGTLKDVGSDIAGDECWRYTIRVAPESVGELEVIFDEIMDAMEVDEFSVGEVKTYTAHRFTGDVGRYVMYEHFTKLGSSQHARGPSLPIPGGKQIKLMITPFERQPLQPMFVLGTKHASFGNGSKRVAAKGKP